MSRDELALAGYKPLTGRVSPATAWSNATVNIDPGSGDGVEVNDPVVSAMGSSAGSARSRAGPRRSS